MLARRDKLLAMLKDNPADSFLVYALALEEAKAGENTSAIERLTGLTATDPSYVPTWFQLGRLLADQGDVARAVEVLDRGEQVAVAAGDAHAASELRGLLSQLSGR